MRSFVWIIFAGFAMWSFSFLREVLYHPVMKILLLSLSVLPMGIFLSSEVKVIFIAVCSQWCFFLVLRKSVSVDDRKYVYLVSKEIKCSFGGKMTLENLASSNVIRVKFQLFIIAFFIFLWWKFDFCQLVGTEFSYYWC